MQVRPPWPSARGAVLSAVLGLAVLPSLIPGGLAAGHPVRPAVDAVVDVRATARVSSWSSGTPARRRSSSTPPR